MIASDGVNTSEDVSDSVFKVGAKGPQVFILSPDTNDTIRTNTAAYLTGSGFDLEDGDLSGSSMEWASNQDGPLGIGSMVRANLSEGNHIITLSATDSDNNATSATINLLVGYKSFLPGIVR